MTSINKPFNWRAFWADLLRGSGHALLTLDGSDEARAAMAGLDYFEAAQNRRAERELEPADDDQTDSQPDTGLVWRERADMPYPTPGQKIRDPEAGGHSRAAGAAFASPTAMGPYPSYPAMSVPLPLGEMAANLRPRRLSANPYDLTELPAQVNFRAPGVPVIRRR